MQDFVHQQYLSVCATIGSVWLFCFTLHVMYNTHHRVPWRVGHGFVYHFVLRLEVKYINDIPMMNVILQYQVCIHICIYIYINYCKYQLYLYISTICIYLDIIKRNFTCSTGRSDSMGNFTWKKHVLIDKHLGIILLYPVNLGKCSSIQKRSKGLSTQKGSLGIQCVWIMFPSSKEFWPWGG